MSRISFSVQSVRLRLACQQALQSCQQRKSATGLSSSAHSPGAQAEKWDAQKCQRQSTGIETPAEGNEGNFYTPSNFSAMAAKARSLAQSPAVTKQPAPTTTSGNMSFTHSYICCSPRSVSFSWVRRKCRPNVKLSAQTGVTADPQTLAPLRTHP